MLLGKGLQVDHVGPGGPRLWLWTPLASRVSEADRGGHLRQLHHSHHVRGNLSLVSRGGLLCSLKEIMNICLRLPALFLTLFLAPLSLPLSPLLYLSFSPSLVLSGEY